MSATNDDVGWSYLRPHRPWAEILANFRHFLLLSASVCFRHLPSAAFSGRSRPVCQIVTWMGPVGRYLDRISGNPSCRWPNSRGVSADPCAVSAIFRFCRVPSASAISRRRPFRVSMVCASDCNMDWVRAAITGGHIWGPNRSWA